MAVWIVVGVACQANPVLHADEAMPTSAARVPLDSCHDHDRENFTAMLQICVGSTSGLS